MFYVYVLKSRNNSRIYIGYTLDLQKRIRKHNKGDIKATKNYIPYDLVYYEAYLEKKDALRRVRQLKSRRARMNLKFQLQNSLKLTNFV